MADWIKLIAESRLPEVETKLEETGWQYKGCDSWEDPHSGLRYGVVKAYEIQEQRESI